MEKELQSHLQKWRCNKSNWKHNFSAHLAGAKNTDTFFKSAVIAYQFNPSAQRTSEKSVKLWPSKVYQ